MIYLEYNYRFRDSEPTFFAVAVTAETISEAARLFMAFEAGIKQADNEARVELTSIGTQKRRGVDYARWGNL